MTLTRVQPSADGQFLHFNDRHGRPCAVWCLIGVPAGAGPWPAVIHCPGGGQAPDAADIAFWNSHGFACVAFDWQHGLYPGHDPARKSQWPPGVVSQDAMASEAAQLIIPLAVQAVATVIDWLEQNVRIDATRIGITGISWGGYLTWVVNAHEPRLRAAVPVYGCGGLFERVHPYRRKQPPVARRAWVADYEPSGLAARQLHPVCHISGTNDFFGWPRHGDRLLDALTVPHRRCWSPNLDHAVEAGASVLAVAWMDHWLRNGPALPAEPQPGDAGEAWWTCSTGGDDHFCWWPGRAPAWATARMVCVQHATLSLTSRIESLKPRTPAPLLPARWSDIRAGLGWHWSLSTTQLHGNVGVGIVPLPEDPSRGTVSGNRTGDLGVVLRMTGDPRWNVPGFTGLRVRLAGLIRPPTQLTVQFTIQRPDGRPQPRLEVQIDSDGWVNIDRLPPGVTWSEATRLDLDGIPGPTFILGPVERLPVVS